MFVINQAGMCRRSTEEELPHEQYPAEPNVSRAVGGALEYRRMHPFVPTLSLVVSEPIDTPSTVHTDVGACALTTICDDGTYESEDLYDYATEYFTLRIFMQPEYAAQLITGIVRPKDVTQVLSTFGVLEKCGIIGTWSGPKSFIESFLHQCINMLVVDFEGHKWWRLMQSCEGITRLRGPNDSNVNNLKSIYDLSIQIENVCLPDSDERIVSLRGTRKEVIRVILQYLNNDSTKQYTPEGFEICKFATSLFNFSQNNCSIFSVAV